MLNLDITPKLGLYPPGLNSQPNLLSTHRHVTCGPRRSRRRHYDCLALRSVEKTQEPLPSSWS